MSYIVPRNHPSNTDKLIIKCYIHWTDVIE